MCKSKNVCPGVCRTAPATAGLLKIKILGNSIGHRKLYLASVPKKYTDVLTYPSVCVRKLLTRIANFSFCEGTYQRPDFCDKETRRSNR